MKVYIALQSPPITHHRPISSISSISPISSISSISSPSNLIFTIQSHLHHPISSSPPRTPVMNPGRRFLSQTVYSYGPRLPSDPLRVSPRSSPPCFYRGKFPQCIPLTISAVGSPRGGSSTSCDHMSQIAKTFRGSSRQIDNKKSLRYIRKLMLSGIERLLMIDA